MLVIVRTHRVDAGVDHLIVTLQQVFVDIFGIVGSKRPETDITRGSTLDIGLAPCKRG
jgi:hypothetical protein